MSFLHIPLAGWVEFTTLIVALVLLARPVGHYVADVMTGRTVFLTPFARPLEKIIYILCRIDPQQGMTPREYMGNLFAFSLTAFLALFLFLYTQPFPHISADMAFNIAASFVTNTNWQSYTPETTLDPIRQMAGLAVENFLSATVGLTVVAAMARCFSQSKITHIGNFWSDMTRGVVYIFLPLSVLLAVFLVSQGVVQSFESGVDYQTIEAKLHETIPLGAVASQVAIKQLGTNGGGYFAANAAHPFENPTPLSNFIQILALLLIPASLAAAFDRFTRRKLHGWTLFWAMMILFVPLALVGMSSEMAGNPVMGPLNVDMSLGNLEGKELRFGAASSALWTAATTATSGGSLNSALDSMMPLSNLVPLAFMHFGEVVFGGVGSGLYGMIIYVLMTAFLAGLMVGRTPEYAGKKIGVYEMKLVSLIIILHAFLILTGTAVALFADAQMTGGLAGAYHGFTQVLYAFSSAAANNGSSMSGITSDTTFMNVALGLCMLVGRYGVLAGVLAIAGSMAEKTVAPETAGTFRTDTPLFTGLLIGVVFIISILTFVPSWAMGPMAEHFHLLSVAGG